MGDDADTDRQSRAPAKSFEDLVVWQKAHALVLAICRLTDDLPPHEMLGLASQLRRAAVSIAANIAEGFPKRTDVDKARFFNTAQGSLEECRYYVILCRDLAYATPTELLCQLGEVSRLLEAYASAVRSSSRRARAVP